MYYLTGTQTNKQQQKLDLNLIDTFKSSHQHSYTNLLAFNIADHQKKRKKEKEKAAKNKNIPSTPSSASIRLPLQHLSS